MQETETSLVNNPKDPKTGQTLSSIHHTSKNTSRTSLYLGHSTFLEELTFSSEESKQSIDDMSQANNYDWDDWLNEINKTANLEGELLKTYKAILAKEIYETRDRLMKLISHQAEDRLTTLNNHFKRMKTHLDEKRHKEQNQIDNWIKLIENQIAKRCQDLSTVENVQILNDLVISDEFSKEKSEWITWCLKTKKEKNDLKQEIDEYWKGHTIFDFEDLVKLYAQADFKILDAMPLTNFQSNNDNPLPKENNAFAQSSSNFKEVIGKGALDTSLKTEKSILDPKRKNNIYSGFKVDEEEEDLEEDHITQTEPVVKEDNFGKISENPILAEIDDSKVNYTVIDQFLINAELQKKVEIVQNAIIELDIKADVLKDFKILLQTINPITDKTIPKLKKSLVDVLNQNSPLLDMVTDIVFTCEDVDGKAMKNFSKVLQNFEALKRLNLIFQKSDKLTFDWIGSFGDILKKFSNLKELRLSFAKWNNVEESYMVILAHALLMPADLSILRLDFSECPKIDNFCIKEFFKMITKQQNLTKLTLIFNNCPKIDDRCIDAIGESYSKMSKLEKLKFDFRNCPKFTRKTKDRLEKYADTMPDLIIQTLIA